MFRKQIDWLLGNRYDYFRCYYPGNHGYLVPWMIRRLVNRINFADSHIQKIKNSEPGAIIVYAGKNKSTRDFLYFHTKLKSLGLPYPRICFDFNFFFLLPLKRLLRILICHLDHFLHHFRFKDAYSTGYAIEELKAGKAGFVFLIEEGDFYKRFIKSKPDPLFLLIELQKNIDTDIVIIPEDIIYNTLPIRKYPTLMDILFGIPENPGIFKLFLILLRWPEQIRIELAKPVNLQDFLKRPEIERVDSEYQAHQLRKYLVDILNRQRKSITGPLIKSRQEITEDILASKSLREYLAQYAAENRLSLNRTHKKAAAYIKEIAANCKAQIINLAEWILPFIFKRIFEDMIWDQEEISRMREKSTEGPLILIPCHKSHLDYLLLPYVMFKNNMPVPHIAAGKNLAFWPLGPIFRGIGAFFLRRTFKGEPLYARMFNAYLEKLLFEGFNIKIFIEGGRSRTGKLLAPRPGGLAMLIEAFRSGACEKLFFVPIFIGYDRVIEEDAYLKELEGGKKTPETLKNLLNSKKILKLKYGKVYMKFSEPISVGEYIKEKNIDLSRVSPQEHHNFVKGFGYKLINAINNNAVAIPHGIIAAAALNCSKNTFTKKELLVLTNTYMNLLIFMKANLSDALQIDPDNVLKSVINNFIQRNFIELADEDDKDMSDYTTFIIKHNKRPVLNYYKNSVISFFSTFAYTALGILELDRFRFSPSDLVQRYKFLEKLFLDEFFFDENIRPEENISSCIKGFIHEGIIVPDIHLSDQFMITSEGLRKLKSIAIFLLPFLESYRTTLNYFEKYETDKHDDKEKVKKIHSIGNKLYKARLISLKESLSLITYKNAVRYFTDNGINGSDDKVTIEFYKGILDRLIRLIWA
ncbi:MAG: glycerol-3-phosphate acyltransferase [Desulfobacula sp.]|jgi:glycerol-3-phosphate O-acyltransferase|nr:glycerol-3-phosphate acyltransferase [Desulfobacula sp.]